jgi:hypothetical protein
MRSDHHGPLLVPTRLRRLDLTVCKGSTGVIRITSMVTKTVGSMLLRHTPHPGDYLPEGLGNRDSFYTGSVF